MLVCKYSDGLIKLGGNMLLTRSIIRIFDIQRDVTSLLIILSCQLSNFSEILCMSQLSASIMQIGDKKSEDYPMLVKNIFPLQSHVTIATEVHKRFAKSVYVINPKQRHAIGFSLSSR